jgi:hypothetical protein
MALQWPGQFEVNAQFFFDADTALRVAGRWPVRKLSLFMEGCNDTYCKGVLGIYESYRSSIWINDTNDHMATLLAALTCSTSRSYASGSNPSRMRSCSTSTSRPCHVTGA